MLRLEQAGGLNTEQGTINSGGEGSSGFQAINLAYHIGATKIILLGYDMQSTGGKNHWFGDHPKKTPEGKNTAFMNGTFGRYVKTFRTIDPARYGIEIINCSRATALDAFPRMRLEDAL